MHANIHLCRSISIVELEAAVRRYESEERPLETALAGALKTLAARMAHAGGEITFEEFHRVVGDLPRVRGERVRFAEGLRVHEEIARLLKKGDFFDGLRSIRSMSREEEEESISAIVSHISSCLPELLRASFEILKRPDSMSALHQNSKFSMEGGALEGSYADIYHFYEGPEKLIGMPNPRVEEGMRREHCERPNAHKLFTAPNYNLTTCPATEYEIVVSPQKSAVYAHTPAKRAEWSEEGKRDWKGKVGREVVKLEVFEQHETVIQAKLQRGEVIAVRLYTGPMYWLYNAALRRSPAETYRSLGGNRYETTIFCVISGILKLSKLTQVPADRRLYRGLGGLILPTEFWRRKEGFRGGVEWGLMSTTADRKVAVQYSGAGGRRGTVLEIAAGRVDIGADLSWVSQYPCEKEFLFPPLTCLEVVDEPRVEGGVIVIPIRANICLKGLTLEQLVERRKELHVAMAKNLAEEVFIAAAKSLLEVWRLWYDAGLTAACH
jgi:NLR family CARD domain-containing protein 3